VGAAHFWRTREEPARHSLAGCTIPITITRETWRLFGMLLVFTEKRMHTGGFQGPRADLVHLEQFAVRSERAWLRAPMASVPVGSVLTGGREPGISGPHGDLGDLLQAAFPCNDRGDDRNRTGVDGFAGRCVATPPRRRGSEA
jgi:hypothetical protein